MCHFRLQGRWISLETCPSLSEGWGELVLRCDHPYVVATLQQGDRIIQQWADPIAALHWLGDAGTSHNNWVGFFSYDLGRWFEPLPSLANNDLKLPLFVLIAQDPASGVSQASGVDRSCCKDQVQGLTELVSTFSREQYQRAVAKVIDYIAAGDIYQVNLSQRFTVPLPDDPLAIYQRLQQQTPATYGAFLDFGDFQIISNSPELFLRVTPDRHVVTRPIKGTRPRLAGMDVELLNSVKDQAELNMIVDLERNDLGRICEIGSVKVTEPRGIEAHPTVYHGVATIEGVLRNDVTLVDLLRATFPGGSVTGAPKIRAMQIIEELEPVRRGPYCGAIGYLAANGTIELNMAIRTMVVRDNLVHVPVGGGIVADSDPAAEYEETLVKARALFAALGIER